MKLTLIAAGKPSSDWAVDAVEHYTRFLSKYLEAELVWVRNVAAKSDTPVNVRRLETERLLAAASKHTGFRVMCDSQGKSYDSPKFAQVWTHGLDSHSGRAIVLIGGPYGLDDTAREWAHLVWSLGPMTMPHELALIVAMEQIARAMSIARGEGYHK
ncbi:MAG: 23S rRNA (pseudouridine(1915)-N(3))-methyltransferase RlmH [Candidatus Zixiibacteriota bacterium]